MEIPEVNGLPTPASSSGDGSRTSWSGRGPFFVLSPMRREFTVTCETSVVKQVKNSDLG